MKRILLILTVIVFSAPAFAFDDDMDAFNQGYRWGASGNYHPVEPPSFPSSSYSNSFRSGWESGNYDRTHSDSLLNPSVPRTMRNDSLLNPRRGRNPNRSLLFD